VAISETINLTGQPAGGRIRYVPLGRFGNYAPRSMYEVQVLLAMDASGDEATINLTEDARFASICTLMNGRVIGAAGGVELLFQMRNNAQAGPISHGFANAVPIASIASANIAVWNPPPVMTMDTWTLVADNVNGDSLSLTAWFYNFDRRILELSPMWQILANLPRPGTMDSFSVA